VQSPLHICSPPIRYFRSNGYINEKSVSLIVENWYHTWYSCFSFAQLPPFHPTYTALRGLGTQICSVRTAASCETHIRVLLQMILILRTDVCLTRSQCYANNNLMWFKRASFLPMRSSNFWSGSWICASKLDYSIYRKVGTKPFALHPVFADI